MKTIGLFVKIMLLSIPCALINLALLGGLERLARGHYAHYPSFFEAVIPQWDVKFWFMGFLFVLFAQALWLVKNGTLTGGVSSGRSGGGFYADAHIPVIPLQAYGLSFVWSVVVLAVFIVTRGMWDYY